MPLEVEVVGGIGDFEEPREGDVFVVEGSVDVLRPGATERGGFFDVADIAYPC